MHTHTIKKIIMIQANELRVGNLMKCNDLFIEVSGISKKSFTCTHRGLIYFNSEDCEPIELTPAILEDCGFEGEQLKLKLTRTKFLEWSYGTDFWLCNEDGDELYEFENIPSLHCLQNLIHSLTGKEIEYKPKK